MQAACRADGSPGLTTSSSVNPNASVILPSVPLLWSCGSHRQTGCLMSNASAMYRHSKYNGVGSWLWFAYHFIVITFGNTIEKGSQSVRNIACSRLNATAAALLHSLAPRTRNPTHDSAMSRQIRTSFRRNNLTRSNNAQTYGVVAACM